MTLETAGAVPRTHEGRRPLDLNHLRSWVCVNFVMEMEIVCADESVLGQRVAAEKRKEKSGNRYLCRVIWKAWLDTDDIKGGRWQISGLPVLLLDAAVPRRDRVRRGHHRGR